jgi:hypothetical protein
MEEGYRGRTLGRNWDKSLKIFPPYYSQSPLLTGFTPPPLRKSGLKLVCNVNIVFGNLKSEISQDYAQRPETSTKMYVHEFSFWTHRFVLPILEAVCFLHFTVLIIQ